MKLLFAKKEKAARLAEKAVVKNSIINDPVSIDSDEDGLGAQAYREMLKDAQVKAATQLKRLARLSTGWDVEPASKDALDIEVAEFIKTQFETMDGTVDDFLGRAMRALDFGMSVHEIVYQYLEAGDYSGKIGLKGLRWKKPESFRLVTDKFGNIESLEQQQGFGTWTKLDLNYFVVWVYDHEGDYKGVSQLKAAYPHWKAKAPVEKFWNIWTERCAIPSVIGKHPSTASREEKLSVVEFLASMTGRKSAAIPADWEIETLKFDGTGEAFERRLKYCDRMIARAILLPTLLMDEGESGSYSLGKSHSDTFRWVLDALGEQLRVVVVAKQVIQRLVDLNYDVTAYPRFVWKPYANDGFEPLANAMVALCNAGICDPDEPAVRQRLDLPPRDDAEITPPKPEPKPEAKPAEERPAAMSQFTNAMALEELRHSDKMNFAAIEAGYDRIEANARVKLIEAVEMWRDSLIKTVKAKRMVENKDFAAIDALRFKGVGEFRDALAEAMVEAVLVGTQHAMNELDRGLDAVGEDKRPRYKKEQRINLSEPEFMDCNFAVQDLIRAFAGKVPILRKHIQQYTARAFTISGVESTKALSRAQELIRAGMLRGASTKTVEQELRALFDPMVKSVNRDVLSSVRLTNIIRTNVSEAYNTARMNLYRDPEVEDFIVAYEYAAVMDDRTTDLCAEWNGTVVEASDPTVDRMMPPNHYQCRSEWIPIVKGEAYEKGSWKWEGDTRTWTPELPSKGPDEGFTY